MVSEDGTYVISFGLILHCVIPLAYLIAGIGSAGVIIQCICTYRVVKSLLDCLQQRSIQRLPSFLNEMRLCCHHLEQEITSDLTLRRPSPSTPLSHPKPPHRPAAPAFLRRLPLHLLADLEVDLEELAHAAVEADALALVEVRLAVLGRDALLRAGLG